MIALTVTVVISEDASMGYRTRYAGEAVAYFR